MKYLPTWLNMKYLIYLHFRPSAWKPPLLIYFEFRGKPSFTVICMDPHSPNKLIVRKYCFLTLGLRWYQFLFLSSFFFVCMFFSLFVIINQFSKIIYYHYFIYFFLKITLIFSRSGMFQNVPCSGFYRRTLESLRRLRAAVRKYRQGECS